MILSTNVALRFRTHHKYVYKEKISRYSDSYDIAIFKLEKKLKKNPYPSYPDLLGSSNYEKLRISPGLNLKAIGTGYVSDINSINPTFLMKLTAVYDHYNLQPKNIVYLKSLGTVCSGDSGSPIILTRKNYQYVIGVISNRVGPHCDGSKEIFATSTGYYSEWIKSITKITPDSGTIKEANIARYPTQYALNSICKNLKNLVDCDKYMSICSWHANLKSCLPD